MSLQLDFFITSDIELLRNEITELRKELSNLRRGLFSRYSDIVRAVQSLTLDVDRHGSRLQRLEGSLYSTAMDVLIDGIGNRRVFGLPQERSVDRKDLVDYSGLPLFAISKTATTLVTIL